jgi:dihydrofolate reductase
MGLSIIYASTPDGIIGVDGKLPWSSLREDMQHFKALTTGHTVIMGRKTYDSIGKALPNRDNLMMTVDIPAYKAPADVYVCRSVDEAIDASRYRSYSPDAFVIGGASIYEALLPRADRIYWTEVDPVYVSETGAIVGDVVRWEFDRSKWWQTGVCKGNTPGVTFYRFDRRIQ